MCDKVCNFNAQCIFFMCNSISVFPMQYHIQGNLHTVDALFFLTVELQTTLASTKIESPDISFPKRLLSNPVFCVTFCKNLVILWKKKYFV